MTLLYFFFLNVSFQLIVLEFYLLNFFFTKSLIINVLYLNMKKSSLLQKLQYKFNLENIKAHYV